MTMRTTAATAAAAAAVLAALLAHGGSTAAAIELIGSKHVIGYYASWQWYDRDKLASPASLDYTKVTRVSPHLITALLLVYSTIHHSLRCLACSSAQSSNADDAATTASLPPPTSRFGRLAAPPSRSTSRSSSPTSTATSGVPTSGLIPRSYSGTSITRWDRVRARGGARDRRSRRIANATARVRGRRPARTGWEEGRRD